MHELGMVAGGEELSPLLVARAAERWPQVRFTVGDVYRPAGERYDLVTALNLIEHLRRPHEAAEAMAARLRPGGLLVVETPTRHSLMQEALSLPRALGMRALSLSRNGHLVLYGPRALQTLLEAHGLRRVEVFSLSGEVRELAGKIRGRQGRLAAAAVAGLQVAAAAVGRPNRMVMIARREG